MNRNRREYRLLLIIIAAVVLIGWFISSRTPELDIVYPPGASTLQDKDFVVDGKNGSFTVGSSSFEDIIALYPAGSNLGSSTVYQPESIDCLFTFTKHENILKVVHISSPEFCTMRGIKVGDSFHNAIIPAYGHNYGYAKLPGTAEDFDAVYGDDSGNIVFQVRNNQVTKMILQHQISNI